MEWEVKHQARQPGSWAAFAKLPGFKGWAYTGSYRWSEEDRCFLGKLHGHGATERGYDHRGISQRLADAAAVYFIERAEAAAA